MFTYHISKCPSKILYNVHVFKMGYSFGKINFQIDKNKAILHNIELKETKKGYGSFLLNNVEKYVKKEYNVDEIHLLAWEPSCGDNVINFFRKNGYVNINHSSQIYDDSITIFDLYKMWKKI
jgi:hypothetical protein